MADPIGFPTGQSNRKMGIYYHVQRGGVPVTCINMTQCTGADILVSNEIHIFDEYNNGNKILIDGKLDFLGNPVDFTSTEALVISGSEIVSNLLGTVIYTRDVDYTINYDKGFIEKKTSGPLQDGVSVKIDYAWHHGCWQQKTGTPWPDCPICHGQGTIPYFAYQARMVFSMPSLQQPWIQGGFFEEGTHYLGTVFDVPINYSIEKQGGPVIRDFIWIHGQPGIWVVNGEPTYAAMDGEFLSKQIPIKRLLVKGKNEPGWIKYPPQPAPILDLPPSELFIRANPGYSYYMSGLIAPSPYYVGTDPNTSFVYGGQFSLPYTFYMP